MKHWIIRAALLLGACFAGFDAFEAWADYYSQNLQNVSYLQTNSNLGCANCLTNANGMLLIRGFATENASVWIQTIVTGTPTGNCINALELPDLVSFNNSNIILDGDATHAGCVTRVFAPAMTSGGLSVKYNPVTSVYMPKMTSTSCKHFYVSHSTGPLISIKGSFPLLDTMNGGLVFSGDSLTDIDQNNGDLPLLTTINGQLELDVNALTSVKLDRVVTINGVNPCAGVELAAVLLGTQTGAALTTVSFAALTTFKGLLDAKGSGIVNVTMPSITTLGNGVDSFLIDLRTNKMTSTTLDMLFNQLGGAGVTITSPGTIRVSGQNPGANPTAASATARGRLTTAGVTLVCDSPC